MIEQRLTEKGLVDVVVAEIAPLEATDQKTGIRETRAR